MNKKCLNRIAPVYRRAGLNMNYAWLYTVSMEIRTYSTMVWSRTYPCNPLININNHGLQAVDKNKQDTTRASALNIPILFVSSVTGEGG